MAESIRSANLTCHLGRKNHRSLGIETFDYLVNAAYDGHREFRIRRCYVFDLYSCS